MASCSDLRIRVGDSTTAKLGQADGGGDGGGDGAELLMVVIVMVMLAVVMVVIVMVVVVVVVVMMVVGVEGAVELMVGVKCPVPDQYHPQSGRCTSPGLPL